MITINLKISRRLRSPTCTQVVSAEPPAVVSLKAQGKYLMLSAHVFVQKCWVWHLSTSPAAVSHIQEISLKSTIGCWSCLGNWTQLKLRETCYRLTFSQTRNQSVPGSETIWRLQGLQNSDLRKPAAVPVRQCQPLLQRLLYAHHSPP